jgi:glycosyltransferase involved in cell wall biosynthesis
MRNFMMRDLVFVSLENWDHIWRRNQFLCAGLMERFPDLQILFVEPPRDVSNHLRQGSVAPLREIATRHVPEFPNLTLTRPLKLFPNSLLLGRRMNGVLARKQILAMMQELKISAPLLWINSHEAEHMAGRLGERAVIYDITDDWTQFGSVRERKIAAPHDDALCRRADLTVVCSQSLLDSRTPRCREILLLPNGVHVAHYRDLAALKSSAPQFPAPVFGYTGTLHPERVDVGLLLALSREYSQGSVVLVGPNLFEAPDQARLQARPNIHFTGAVPYSEIPRHMAAFDVCIVPHLETPFTQSLNPLKLWEYLACGKPIASTNVAGFAEHSRLCHIGSGEENFLNACRAALAETEDTGRTAQRQQIAAQHSWDARLDVLLDALEKLE